jgi:hypothetical protein
MSAEGGVTACCCLGRGRVAVTAEVVGGVVAGAPLHVRVAVDNSSGSAAVSVRLLLGRMLLLHTGKAAQAAAAHATAMAARRGPAGAGASLTAGMAAGAGASIGARAASGAANAIKGFVADQLNGALGIDLSDTLGFDFGDMEAAADFASDETEDVPTHASGAAAAAMAGIVARGGAGIWAKALAKKRGSWGTVQDEMEGVEVGEVDAGATAHFESFGDIKLPADSAATGGGGMLAFFEMELCVAVSSSACGSDSVAAYMALRPGFPQPAVWGLVGPGSGNAAEATFLSCGELVAPRGVGSVSATQVADPLLAKGLVAASARSGAAK